MGSAISSSAKGAQRREEAEAIRKKREWYGTTTFDALSPEGRDAFIEYTEKCRLNNDTRRLKFWFFLSREMDESLTAFAKCIDDGDDQLTDVSWDDDDVETVLGDAAKMNSYAKTLKDRMAPKLDEPFRMFKESLRLEIEAATRS